MSPQRKTPERSLADQACEVNTQLWHCESGLRTLAALLDCWGDHGTEGHYQTGPAFAFGVSSMVSLMADAIAPQCEAVERLGDDLRDIEPAPRPVASHSPTRPTATQ